MAGRHGGVGAPGRVDTSYGNASEDTWGEHALPLAPPATGNGALANWPAQSANGNRPKARLQLQLYSLPP